MSWQGAGDAAELDDARGLVMKTFNDDDGIVTKDEFGGTARASPRRSTGTATSRRSWR